MKRDLNLVREILLWANEQDAQSFSKNPEIKGYTEEQVSYHVYLMEQAGLVRAIKIESISGPPEAILSGVTWAGHDFADAAKDSALWRRATIAVLKEGQSFTFESLKLWLSSNFPVS